MTGALLVSVIETVAGHRDVPETAVALWLGHDGPPVNAYAAPSW